MSVKPIPEGMHTVTPHLVCDGAAEAIAFYKKAFDAIEVSRMPGPGGKLMHAAVRIGDSTVMLVDEAPQWQSFGPLTLKGSPVTIHLYVPDVDATYAQAIKAGHNLRLDQPLGIRREQAEQRGYDRLGRRVRG